MRYYLENRTTLLVFLSEEEEMGRFLNLAGFERHAQDKEDAHAYPLASANKDRRNFPDGAYLVVSQDVREFVSATGPPSREKIAEFGRDQKLLIYSTSTAQ